MHLSPTRVIYPKALALTEHLPGQPCLVLCRKQGPSPPSSVEGQAWEETPRSSPLYVKGKPPQCSGLTQTVLKQ